jgi:small subunit ribosomal protein S6
MCRHAPTFLPRPLQAGAAIVHGEGNAIVRAYEAVVVLAPTLDEDAVEGFLARARQAVEQKGGQLRSVERWGKRRLAYDIKHFKEGIYVLLRFQAPEPDGTRELDHVCRISEQVLRHLIVRAVEGASARPDAKADDQEAEQGGQARAASA